MGNVIATVSDRKIQLVKCKTLNAIPVDPYSPIDNNRYSSFAVHNADTLKVDSMLRVTPLAKFGGVSQDLSITKAGTPYVISFDIEIGSTTPQDNLYAKIYGLSSSTGSGKDSSFVLITASGHYELTYTAQPQTTSFKIYYNSAPSTKVIAHSFYIYNIILADPVPINPPTPANPVNILSLCNHAAGADFLHYFPDLLMHTDYYAFGQEMPGRTWYGTADKYRYEFNGKETDKETSSGASDFGMREYDDRLGRFFTLDPYKKLDACTSPYAFAGNSPIAFVDEEGGFRIAANKGTSQQRKKLTTLIRLVSKQSSQIQKHLLFF